MLFRSRWYCCIIGVSASCIVEFLPCQSQLNLNRRAACDFLFEIELNTIANALQRLLGSDGEGENLHGINVKRADLGRFDGRAPPSTLPLTDLQYFLKRGE